MENENPCLRVYVPQIHVDLSEIPLLEGVRRPNFRSIFWFFEKNKILLLQGVSSQKKSRNPHALPGALIMSHFQKNRMTPSKQKKVVRAVLMHKLIRINLGP